MRLAASGLWVLAVLNPGVALVLPTSPALRLQLRGAPAARQLQLRSTAQDDPTAVASATTGAAAPDTPQQQSRVDKVNEQSKKFGGPLSGVTDVFSGAAFAALHAFDDCGIQDAAKNLRVLWTRALLANSDVLADDVAYELLPESTRGVVSRPVVKLWESLLPFCDWIRARTEFLDSMLDSFIEAQQQPGDHYQVVLIGSGYDTRAIRRQDDPVTFFEVDLPEVVEGKQRLYDKYVTKHPSRGRLPVSLGMDLDDARQPGTLLDKLYNEGGLKADVPTLFIFEAVMFYLEEEAVQGIFADIGAHAQTAETMLALTDSLRGLGVTKPFMADVAKMFKERGFELISHRAQWGGAVHFTSAVSTKEGAMGPVSAHLTEKLGSKIVDSYAPQYTLNSGKLLKDPSFRKTWYAVALSDHIATNGKPFATRLWGEPMALFRTDDGEVVCLRDVCPHRAAPLSLGEVKDGKLSCLYHGWSFAQDGQCVDVPTMPAGMVSSSLRTASPKGGTNTKGLCATHYAVVERNGMVFVWGGNTLEADVNLLPTQRPGEKTLFVDTVLDYNVDWQYIVENNLDSPHIYWLHDGSIPPLESLGFNRDHVDKFSLRKFQDEIGVGHVGKTDDKSTTKIVRFDAPNIVRHCGVSGFSEEFHIVPVAPHRTRVLLRQHFPKGPILSIVESNWLMMRGFVDLMRWWNWNIALEDYSVMQGQAHNIEDLGARNINRAGLGDDLISEFYKWRSAAMAKEGNPFFFKWAPELSGAQQHEDRLWSPAVAGGTAGESRHAVVDDGVGEGGLDGTWGIKASYIQQTPPATEPPVNAKGFRRAWTMLKAGERAVDNMVPMAVMAAFVLAVGTGGGSELLSVQAMTATDVQ